MTKQTKQGEKRSKGEKVCKHCGLPVNEARENLPKVGLMEIGRTIYYGVLDHFYRSIDLCNFCYSVMRSYKNSQKIRVIRCSRCNIPNPYGSAHLCDEVDHATEQLRKQPEIKNWFNQGS